MRNCHFFHIKLPLFVVADDKIIKFQGLYDPKRWKLLIDQFKADNFALCCLTSQPLLSITLQAGLSALKTSQCQQHEDKNLNCPVCDKNTLGALAKSLPLSHHVNSSIVCRLSGKKIDENNPPMLLPNGRVYSLQVKLQKNRSHDLYTGVRSMTKKLTKNNNHRLWKRWLARTMDILHVQELEILLS